MSTFRKTESKVESIEDAINFINNRLLVNDFTASATNFLPIDSITLASRDQLTASSTLNILARCPVQEDEQIFTICQITNIYLFQLFKQETLKQCYSLFFFLY